MEWTLIPKRPRPVLLVLPLFGMGMFVLLYILAAMKYPGGSWTSMDQQGFSFWNNYLCDLLDEIAINGELNAARYYARASLAFLCGSLLVLWFYLPGLFPKKGINVRLMWFAGILALGTTFFLASGTHDIIVRIAGVFGVLAFVSCFIELYKAKYYLLFWLGVFCLGIFLINYYIYETGTYIRSLPVIQKITFVFCLLWFVFLDIRFLQKLRSRKAGEG